MHGVIFTGFRAFVSSEFPEIGEALWAERPRYLATSTYDDEAFGELLEQAGELSGWPQDVLLRRFGIFAAGSTFRLLYPDFYAAHRDTASFLLDVEEQIHSVVRRTFEGAAPPRLVVERRDGGGVEIVYTSERRLCALLEGLVTGVSRVFGERLRVEQPACMHRGDAACTFVVTAV